MNKSIFIVLFLGVFLRVVVCSFNAFSAPTLGADLDALTFHSTAVANIGEPHFQNTINGWFYADYLSIIYELTYPSIFLGGIASIIFWLFSALVLYKITELFMMTETQKFWAMSLFCLMPSSILFTSVTLREAYEILFINICLYSFFKIYLKNKFRYYVLAIFSIFMSSKLHIALLIPACSLLFFAILLRFNKKNIYLKMFVISIFVLFLAQNYNENYYNFTQALSDFRFNASSIEARANFSSMSESDVHFYISRIPKYFLMYMTEPLPWRLNSFLDFGVMIENLIRLLLVFSSFYSLFKLQGDRKKLIFVLLTTYLLTEAIWAIGSVNYGTAIRHQLTTLGLLSIISIPFIKKINPLPT
jgi:hypothetical protein